MPCNCLLIAVDWILLRFIAFHITQVFQEVSLFHVRSSRTRLAIPFCTSGFPLDDFFLLLLFTFGELEMRSKEERERNERLFVSYNNRIDDTPFLLQIAFSPK